MQTVVSRSFDMVMADAQRVALNAHTPLVKLFKNDYTPNKGTTLADLVEATYDGYVPQSSSFGPVFVDANGQLSTVQNPGFYSAAAGNPSESIFGAFVENTITGVIAAARLDRPAAMGELDQGIPLGMKYRDGILVLSVQS